jgi:hypothetical protein
VKDGTHQLVSLPVICARTVATAQEATFTQPRQTTIVLTDGTLTTLHPTVTAPIQPKRRLEQSAEQGTTLTAAPTTNALSALKATTATQMAMVFTLHRLGRTAAKHTIVRLAPRYQLLVLPTTLSYLAQRGMIV